MFTGIVTALGHIVATHSLRVEKDDAAFGSRLTIETSAGYLDDVAAGDSIALNGACMTVTAIDLAQRRFFIDVSAESLARTTGLDAQGVVNLEKALRAHDRLGGHLVSGHVDGIGRVTRLEPVGESFELRVNAPPELARFIALKGSIAVNGVSLTVNAVLDHPDGCEFSVNVIPHTLQNTTLGQMKVGDKLNLEIDLIARYVERLHTRLTGTEPRTISR
jgi:riboflavin synthase